MNPRLTPNRERSIPPPGVDLSPRTADDGGGELAAGKAAELAEAVRELAEIVRARRPQQDDDDEPRAAEVVFARDPAALAELLSRHPLPPVYAAFLARHSSHDFVATGLVCAGEAAWIAAVDTVAELTRCCEGAAPMRVVCGVSADGYYALDLARTRGDECPVLYVDAGGDTREVASGFVGFLQRVARESSSGHVQKDMSREVAEREHEQARSQAQAWLAVAGLVVAGLIACGVMLLR